MQKTIVAVLVLSACAWAQNPVSDGLRERLKDAEKNTVAAAEEMPADKYGYKPTETQSSFGHVVSHAIGANYLLCSKLTGATAAKPDVKESDAKDKLVEGLKKSFQYCSTQLSKLQDSQLGEEVLLFGSEKMTKGAAVLETSADWAGHYSQMSGYLRLNGMLPPTAKKKE
jgi:uncharacterized damage-inducible protein DinB